MGKVKNMESKDKQQELKCKKGGLYKEGGMEEPMKKKSKKDKK